MRRGAFAEAPFFYTVITKPCVFLYKIALYWKRKGGTQRGTALLRPAPFIRREHDLRRGGKFRAGIHKLRVSCPWAVRPFFIASPRASQKQGGARRAVRIAWRQKEDSGKDVRRQKEGVRIAWRQREGGKGKAAKGRRQRRAAERSPPLRFFVKNIFAKGLLFAGLGDRIKPRVGTLTYPQKRMRRAFPPAKRI